MKQMSILFWPSNTLNPKKTHIVKPFRKFKFKSSIYFLQGPKHWYSNWSSSVKSTYKKTFKERNIELVTGNIWFQFEGDRLFPF